MQAQLITYAQRDSVWHRLDARWKLAAVMVSIAAVAFVQTIPAAVLAFLAALVLLLASGLPPRSVIARLGGVGLFLSLFLIVLPLTMPGDDLRVGPLRLSLEGLRVAFLITLKALAVVAVALFLLATSRFEVTLKAAQALFIPRLLVQLLMLTYRYVFLFADELHKLRVALRLRSFRNRVRLHSYRTIGQVAGTLLVRSYERAERVSQAMRCRGFDGQFRSLNSFRTKRSDVAGFAVLVFALGGLPWIAETGLLYWRA